VRDISYTIKLTGYSIPEISDIRVHLHDGRIVNGSHHQGDGTWYVDGSEPFFIGHGCLDFLKNHNLLKDIVPGV
jgi:hypothetical protein